MLTALYTSKKIFARSILFVKLMLNWQLIDLDVSRFTLKEKEIFS